MPALTYESIQPLIASEQVRGTTIEVVFRCPVTGESHTSSASAQQGTGSKVATAVKSSMWYSLRNAMSNMVRSFVGGGVAGNLASSAMYAAPTSSGTSYSISGGEKKTAILEAFKRVQQNFSWDANSNRYVSSKHLQHLLTEFSKMMNTVTIREKWDRSVLARMLAEIAAADGNIGAEERGLFDAFAGSGTGTIDEILRQGKLSPAELGGTTQNVREAMFAMACVLAYSDEELGAAEQERLMQFAAGLGITGQRLNILAKMAREQVVDMLLEAIYADGVADNQEKQRVGALAYKIGVDIPTVEALDVNLRRRKGIS